MWADIEEDKLRRLQEATERVDAENYVFPLHARTSPAGPDQPMSFRASLTTLRQVAQ